MDNLVYATSISYEKFTQLFLKLKGLDLHKTPTKINQLRLDVLWTISQAFVSEPITVKGLVAIGANRYAAIRYVADLDLINEQLKTRSDIKSYHVANRLFQM